MHSYDVFNGDADGICALLQLRLVNPRVSTLVTGVKRDINLLANVDPSEGDQLTVLDVSMAKNNVALQAVLAQGASVFYIDHHLSGEIPQHENLQAIIDTSPVTCTSLLTNGYLQGQFVNWAITGAYGDNMQASAKVLVDNAKLSEKEREGLCRLGVAINYNGYGASIDDLHYHPAKLYNKLLPYTDPLDCVTDPHSIYHSLYAAYEADLAQTTALTPEYSTNAVAVYRLPDAAWARRVSGVFGNALANAFPSRAHSIISHHPKGGHVVSVRAPKTDLRDAGTLCQQFATGGGREGAGGINQLPADQLSLFIDRFQAIYQL